MNTLQILAEVLTDAEKNEAVPQLRFKSSNSLNEEVIRLSGMATVNPTEESDTDRVNRFVAEITQSVDDETGEPSKLEDAIFTNEMCDRIASIVADKMTTATAKLRVIHNEVTALTSDITKRYNRTVSSDPFLAKYANENAEADIDYLTMGYDALELLGGIKNTVAYVLNESGASEDTMVLESKFKNVVGKFANRKLLTNDLVGVVLTKEQKTEIVEKTNVANKALLVDTVRTVLNVMVNDSSMKAIRNRVVRTIERDEATKVTVEMLAIVSDYRKTVGAIAKVMDDMELDVPESTTQFFNDLTDLCGFSVHWHRINTFQNTVLFKNRTLNPDLESKLSDEKLTLQDIAQHIQFRYRDFELPSGGITLSTLAQGKERIAKEVEKETSSRKVRVDAGLHDAKHNAFMGTMIDFLDQDENREQIGSIASVRSYVVSCANKVTNEGSSCEDVIYLVMEKLLYRDDFVMVLREQLGMDYVNAVATNKNLSAADVATVNSVVYARMITEYMKTQFMEEV